MNALFSLIIKFRNTQLVILSEIDEEYERIREVRNVNAQKRVLRNFQDEDDGGDDGGDEGNY